MKVLFLVQFQPKKSLQLAMAANSDFDKDFKFVSSIEEYNKDTWNDLMKYIKRKATTKTDDRIAKVRNKICMEEDVKEEVDSVTDATCDQVEEDELQLSDTELKHDRIRDKAKKTKKRRKQSENEEFFSNDYEANTNVTNFYQMNLSRPLLKAITRMKFVHPTPVQQAAIPVALLGRDICGCAATGTGKTAAYMLPTLERLLYRPVDQPITRVLCLVPTRELGVQVYQVVKQLAQFTSIQVGLAIGGLDLKAQEAVLRRTPDIVIATPGRLIDHTRNTPTFTLDSIEVLILDEADRMLDEYFAEQMKQIVGQCSRTRQTMLFSATMTDTVEELAAVSLQRPIRLFIDSNHEVALNLRQEFIRIRTDCETDREPILAALICRTFRTNCMVFVQTKRQAHRLHILLGLLNVRIAELHGNLTQAQRLDSLAKFRESTVDVLVATDVAARGLDIVGVKTVINFVMPATVEHYIHRVGRTARAGRAGVSVSLAGEQERKLVKSVVKKAKTPVKMRLIPADILERYRQKCQLLDTQIEKILQAEYEERALNRAEKQVNHMQNKLVDNTVEKKRDWFQSKQARQVEKQKLQLIETVVSKNTLKKRQKNTTLSGRKISKSAANKNPEDRIGHELERVAMLQARFAKKQAKPSKIRTVVDDDSEPGRRKAQKRGRTSQFCDTSTNRVKRLRYEANQVQKKRKLMSKKQQLKSKGKSFGMPQQKKRH